MRLIWCLLLCWGCAQSQPVTIQESPAQPAGPRTLTEAVRAHDFRAVRHFVEDLHANPNEMDAEGQTPLVAALSAYSTYWHPHDEDQDNVAQYLLHHGGDPNHRFTYGDVKGITAMHIAAYHGRLAEVQLLVEAGANPNLADERGMTPAHEAAVCDFRLSCDECGDVPGHPHIGAWGAKPVLEYLVAHGADLHKKTKKGEDVLAIVTPSDCKKDPKRCAGANGEPFEWYSGTCRQTYLFVREAAKR